MIGELWEGVFLSDFCNNWITLAAVKKDQRECSRGRGALQNIAIIQTSHSDGIDQGGSCAGDVRGSDFEYILKIFFLPVINQRT